jgi:hypothetical protein
LSIGVDLDDVGAQPQTATAISNAQAQRLSDVMLAPPRRLSPQ